MGYYSEVPAYWTVICALNGSSLTTLAVVAWDEKYVKATCPRLRILEAQAPRRSN